MGCRWSGRTSSSVTGPRWSSPRRPTGGAGGGAEAGKIVEHTPGAFMPPQFSNPANPRIHRLTTAKEILAATDGTLHAFVAGVGTGGTVTGVGEVLKKKDPSIQVVAIEPAASPVLSGGAPG